MSDYKKGCIEDILKKLPPGYGVGGVYLRNGSLVPVTTFSNVCDCCAYFIGEDCQVCVFDTDKIDGLCFGPAEAPDADEE